MKLIIYLSGTYNVTQDKVRQLLEKQPEDERIPIGMQAHLSLDSPEWQEIKAKEKHTGILLDQLDTDKLGRRDLQKIENIYKVTIEDSGECSIEKIN